VVSTSPPAEASAAPPTTCGVHTDYTWIDPNGKETPDEALDAYRAAIVSQKPADATESATHTALLTALAIATAADKTGGLVTYEARDGETLLGIFQVIGMPGNGYLVTSSWVPLPEALCSAAQGGH
jgi:hypothetical protein